MDESRRSIDAEEWSVMTPKQLEKVTRSDDISKLVDKARKSETSLLDYRLIWRVGQPYYVKLHPDDAEYSVRLNSCAAILDSLVGRALVRGTPYPIVSIPISV